MHPDWPGITDRQWARVERAFHWYQPPVDRRRKVRRIGRPRVPDRTVVDGIVWAIGGGTVDRLPRRFGSPRTVRRRVARWERSGHLQLLWQFYVESLSPLEACEWWVRFRCRRAMPFWQECAVVLFRAAHRDPFTRLAACQNPASGASPPS